MSQIRKRSLKTTSWIYIGFLIGAINTYFFTHNSWFVPSQYGLTRSLLDIGMLISAFSALGVPNFLVKFFPYYSNNLEKKENDLLSLALYIAITGFVISIVSLFALQPLIIKKFGTNSPLLIEYFYYVIPFSFFILLYNILESYAYGYDKGVLTSVLKETILRLYTTIIIVLKLFHVINFQQFIFLFSLQYFIIVSILAIHLKKENKLWISFKLSKVSRKYKKKIFKLLILSASVIIVGTLRQTIDVLVLAAKQDLGKVGVFGFASYLVATIHAPFRSLVAIALPILSRSWREKNIQEIDRIYKRSSINLLTFGLFIFICGLLNFDNAIIYFNLDPAYLQGKWVFILLGLVAIIEVGTGVNGQIIGTSTRWEIELYTSLLLTLLIIPLSYFLTVKYGIIGPALANVISFSIYNAARIWYLWANYKMQPFSKKTIEIILIAAISYFIAYMLFGNSTGIGTMIISTGMLTIIYASAMYYRNISPDVKPVISTLLKRIRRS